MNNVSSIFNAQLDESCSPKQILEFYSRIVHAENVLKNQTSSVAAILHAKAHNIQKSMAQCLESEDGRKELVREFKGYMIEAEDYILSEQAGELRLTKLPPAYSAAMRKITNAWLNGGNLDELTTCSACEKFNNETNKAKEQAERESIMRERMKERGIDPDSDKPVKGVVEGEAANDGSSPTTTEAVLRQQDDSLLDQDVYDLACLLQEIKEASATEYNSAKQSIESRHRKVTDMLAAVAHKAANAG